MANSSAAAAALGARTARACDGCMRRRARWHCHADDAFLCAACDAAVHSANAVARRHRRVRVGDAAGGCLDAPSWLQRRARTPRGKAKHALAARTVAVPDVENDDSSGGAVDDMDDAQLLFRVPVFDPSLVELCELEPKPDDAGDYSYASTAAAGNCFSGFGVSDEDFADMESLMGVLNDGDAVDNLGFLDIGMDMGDTPPPTLQEADGTNGTKGEHNSSKGTTKTTTMEMMLRLDYDAVMAAWSADGRSPWTTGVRPREPWTDSTLGTGLLQGRMAVAPVTSEGRQARVSRYREKRRTRLFEKKIRYEVRKLNAEKRPRMKGRFVKRSSPAVAPAVQHANTAAACFARTSGSR